MIGSLHLGLQDDSLVLGEAEEDLLAHLATMISSCFKMRGHCASRCPSLPCWTPLPRSVTCAVLKRISPGKFPGRAAPTNRLPC